MDRDRLSQVQHSDLTESNVNEDFVLWLRTKGPTWLLAILLGLCLYFGIDIWRQNQATHKSQAWVQLSEVSTPQALLDVAGEYDDVGAVPIMARIAAADKYLEAVQVGGRYDRTPDQNDYQLTSDLREEYLQQANQLYDEVLEMVGDAKAKTIFAASALFGKAAVAESQGNLDEARSLLEQIIARADPGYDSLAREARQRKESLGTLSTAITLPSLAEVPDQTQPAPVSPPVIEPIVNDLLGTPPNQPSTSRAGTPSQPIRLPAGLGQPSGGG